MQLRLRISPIWYCFSSPCITGPDVGRSSCRRKWTKIETWNENNHRNLLQYHYYISCVIFMSIYAQHKVFSSCVHKRGRIDQNRKIIFHSWGKNQRSEIEKKWEEGSIPLHPKRQKCCKLYQLSVAWKR